MRTVCVYLPSARTTVSGSVSQCPGNAAMAVTYLDTTSSCLLFAQCRAPGSQPCGAISN